MCVVVLCMTMCITVFAAESFVVPDGYEIVEFADTNVIADFTKLKNGKTYFFTWKPLGNYSSGTAYFSFVSIYKNGSSFDNPVEVYALNSQYGNSFDGLYGKSGSTRYLISYDESCAWDSNSFSFSVSKASEVKANQYITVSFTVPNDGATYYIGKGGTQSSNYTADYYFYAECDHVYDNSCDVNCNSCGTEREITHTYFDENDHTCIVCGFDNPNPTHVFLSDNDHTCIVCHFDNPNPTHVFLGDNDHLCIQCNYINDNPTHVYDNDKDLTCNYCDYERPKLSVWDNLKGLSTFLFGMVGLAASVVMENLYLQVACIGVPVILLSLAFFSDLLRKRV